MLDSPTSKGACFAGQRILVLCPFPEGLAPAQRLKYEQYIDHWRELGAEVDISPFSSDFVYPFLWERGFLVRKTLAFLIGLSRRARDILSLRRYDLVYVFLWVTPFGLPFTEFLVRILSKRLIYDVDDNVHVGQKLDRQFNPNYIFRFLKGGSKPRYLMRRSDAVIASSPDLAATAAAINSNGHSTYITSSVDTDYFSPRLTRSPGKIVIGWTGTFSSRPFIDLIAPALISLQNKRDFEFCVIGNFDYSFPGLSVRNIRFSQQKEVEDLHRLDIGLYPLPDNPWITGKSGLKAIVYMAIGIPVVASGLGTTKLLFSRGDIGMMTSSNNNIMEWENALLTLIDDEELRSRKGANARLTAVQYYSRQAVREQYTNVLAPGTAPGTR